MKWYMRLRKWWRIRHDQCPICGCSLDYRDATWDEYFDGNVVAWLFCPNGHGKRVHTRSNPQFPTYSGDYL